MMEGVPMTVPQKYTFQHYLASKKSVDDRALNRHVWQTLARELPHSTPDKPLRALEIGAGIGTMIERALNWELFTCAEYTALDSQAGNIDEAWRRLPSWAGAYDFQIPETRDKRVALLQEGRSISVQMETIDLFDFIVRERGRKKWDLLIAHAFLDLMDIASTLPLLFELIAEDGLFYFSITFDGMTLLEPVIDPELDNCIQTLYHRTMDERLIEGKPSGDSRAGRHLFAYLKDAGAEILDVGASDWVVFPGPRGYPHDEAYFLHHILDTIHHALQGHPELDASRFERWIAERHAQVEQYELVYIAHQLDFVGRVSKAIHILP